MTFSSHTRSLAEGVIKEAKYQGTITGMVGAKIVTRPITLQRLADYGVPENLDIPYDSGTLRDLVRELAQLEVD